MSTNGIFTKKTDESIQINPGTVFFYRCEMLTPMSVTWVYLSFLPTPPHGSSSDPDSSSKGSRLVL